LWEVNARRNVELAVLAQALQSVDAVFFSLQKGEPAQSQIHGQEHVYWPRHNFVNWANDLSDFAHTAALIEQLDLVISVDTSTAHVAAALGKPVWLLNRHDSCWRWLLEREDSPWYPSVRVYRQGPQRDWGEVLARVRLDLEQSHLA
jgi:ADP-heptose:LPS heptosyltransferase